MKTESESGTESERGRPAGITRSALSEALPGTAKPNADSLSVSLSVSLLAPRSSLQYVAVFLNQCT